MGRKLEAKNFTKLSSTNLSGEDKMPSPSVKRRRRNATVEEVIDTPMPTPAKAEKAPEPKPVPKPKAQPKPEPTPDPAPKKKLVRKYKKKED